MFANIACQYEMMYNDLTCNKTEVLRSHGGLLHVQPCRALAHAERGSLHMRDHLTGVDGRAVSCVAPVQLCRAPMGLRRCRDHLRGQACMKPCQTLGMQYNHDVLPGLRKRSREK